MKLTMKLKAQRVLKAKNTLPAERFKAEMIQILMMMAMLTMMRIHLLEKKKVLSYFRKFRMTTTIMAKMLLKSKPHQNLKKIMIKTNIILVESMIIKMTK